MIVIYLCLLFLVLGFMAMWFGGNPSPLYDTGRITFAVGVLGLLLLALFSRFAHAGG